MAKKTLQRRNGFPFRHHVAVSPLERVVGGFARAIASGEFCVFRELKKKNNFLFFSK